MKLPKPKRRKPSINVDDFHFETECLNPDCKGYGKDMTLIKDYIAQYKYGEHPRKERLYQCDFCKTVKVV